MAAKKTFPVYKGLQRPMVFRGFKGKYIFWGIGSVVLAVLVGGILSAAVSRLLGGFVMVLLLAGGLYYTSWRQKRGLYTRNVKKGVFIIPPHHNTSDHGKAQRL
jgi:hypothetical protein